MDYWWSEKCNLCGRDIEIGETFFRVSKCKIYEPHYSHVHIPSTGQPQPDVCYCQKCADFIDRIIHLIQRLKEETK